MSTTLTNGRQRKSLAEQIDRLDSVLDGLADGFERSGRYRCQGSRPRCLDRNVDQPRVARLAARWPAGCRAGTVPTEPMAGPGAGTAFGQRCAGRPRRAAPVWLRFCQVVDSVRGQVAETTRRCCDNSVRLVVAGTGALMRARWLLAPILAAAVLAGLTGVAAYHLGPWMAAGVSGAGGLGTALAKPGSGSWLSWAWPWRASAE